MINREQRIILHKRRINEVYPDLPIRTLASIEGNGQNNDIVVVDNAVVFRFPRYPEGIGRLERTTRILRAVKTFVSLPVPDPIYSSFEPGDVGSVFVGYPLIPGEPLRHAALDGIVDEATSPRSGRPGDTGGSVHIPADGALGRSLRSHPSEAVFAHAPRCAQSRGATLRSVPRRSSTSNDRDGPTCNHRPRVKRWSDDEI